MNETCISKLPRFQSIDRTQILLRTTDVESLIAEDHPARAIWIFLSRLDLSKFSEEQRAVEVAVAPMGAVLGLRRALPDHFALSAISLIAPHARFLAVQQIGQYHRIGYVGRRRHRRVDDLRLAIYSHVRLHPEVPLF